MKKIRFYILPDSNDNQDKIYWEYCRNSLFSYNSNTGKHMFNSKFNQPEELDVGYLDLHLRTEEEMSKIYDDLCELAKVARHQATSLSEEPVGDEKVEGSINGAIGGILTKSSYEPFDSIFDLIAALFIKIISGHYLHNGNKRVGLLFLIAVSNYFGYHLNWSSGMMQDYKSYIPMVEKFVKDLQNMDSSKYNIKVKEIGAWILKNSTIAMEWR